jgi:hypothetical protein
MKIAYFLILLNVFFGCKTKQEITNDVPIFFQNITCPDDGNCTFEVLKDSSLEIKTDEFGNLYPEISSGNKLVVKYHYKRNEIKNTADSSYSEFIYFELDNQEENFILKDIDLQKVKLLYGRICFCRGSSGYFKITSGTLFVDKHGDKLDVDLRFKSPKGIPQIITQIKETISY